MIQSKLFLILVIILLFLSFFFYTVEGFVNDDIHDSVIVVTDSGPIDSVHIRYDADREGKDQIGGQNPGPINISDLVIYNKNHKRIPYWNGEVYFEDGGHPAFPVRHLWDERRDTFAHSLTERANMIVKLNPPEEVGSIQITNRQGCCWDRIQNYKLVIYKGGREIGSTRLFQLGNNGKTVNYILVNGLQKGIKGDKGQRGLQGIQGIQGVKGDKGDKGLTGITGTKGPPGYRGPDGENGNKGPNGEKGPIGPIGLMGAQGPQGIQGIQGPRGIQGINGVTGNVGDHGIEGIAGGKCFRD